MRSDLAPPHAAEPANAELASSSRRTAWFAIGALTAWLACALVEGWPEAPAEPSALRWVRTAAEHPVRTSFAVALLTSAALRRGQSRSN